MLVLVNNPVVTGQMILNPGPIGRNRAIFEAIVRCPRFLESFFITYCVVMNQLYELVHSGVRMHYYWRKFIETLYVNPSDHF